MRKNKMIAIALLIIFSSITALSQKHQLVQLWETDSVFKVPESVVFDAKNKMLYVSNIEGTDPWGKDGKGSIGKMSADGKVIAAQWVTGLEAPKGMGLYKQKLYVADMTDLVVIDVTKGQIEKRIPVTGAQGLNDVSVDDKGVVYVTDSRGKKLYKVTNGVSELYLENLKGPNGVLRRGNDLYILDAGGAYKVNADKSLSLVVDGMEGGTDGIENIKGNDFIVSCWAGTIYYINEDGTKELLKDTRPQKWNTADLGIDPKKKVIFIPTFWKNTVIAYEVK
jgi:DNA-binding beta-propeller fold protein YncE